MRRSTAAAAALASLLVLAGCASGSMQPVPPWSEAPPAADERADASASAQASFGRADAVSIVKRDAALFTQGAEFGPDGSLYHSGGRYGQSRVVRTSAEGAVLAEYELPAKEFAEGLTLVGDEVFLLTWRESIVRVLDADDLGEVRTLNLGTEGWGACFDEEREVVWVADGSATVRGYEPGAFSEVEAFDVVDDAGEPLHRLNELECIGGEVWANRWQLDEIVVFEPPDGVMAAEEELPAAAVERTISLPEISPDADGRDAVLNGIAFDAEHAQVWITGKLWSEFFVFDYELLRGEPAA